MAASPRGDGDGLPRPPAPRPVRLPEPAAPVPVPAPARDGAPAPAAVGAPVAAPAADGGLPRRVRRASLAPQLLEPRAPERTPGPQGVEHDVPERTAEQARSTMAAFRRGWIRGGGAGARDAADEAPAGPRPLRAAPQRSGVRPGPGGPDHQGGPDTTPEDGEQDHARTTDPAPREGEHR